MDTPKKRKIYAKKFYAWDNPPDGGPMPSEQTAFPKGPWMTGIETFQFIDGRQVTMVKLKDGSEEPLSELLVIPDRREKEREDPLEVLFRKAPPSK
jgi:hypothetical protein